MQKHNKYINWDIIYKSINGNLTIIEKQEFEKWLKSSKQNKLFYLNFKNNLNKDLSKLTKTELATHKSKILSEIKVEQNKTKKLFINLFKYAAVFILPIAIAGYLLMNKNNKIESKIESNYVNHIINAGVSKAILIKSDGKKIDIDSVNRNIKEIGNVNILLKNNLLSYVNVDVDKTKFNTLIIPRGAEHKIILSDSTVVWLNSNSELKYPISFTNNKRQVYLKGEAYFQVKKNKKKQFEVNVQNVDIKVFGTQFNVNAQENDLIKTTLVEGSVGVKFNGQVKMLKPGYQSQVNKLKNKSVVKKVNILPEIAWKDGKFVFEEQTLEQIMNKLSLWYDVKVFFMNDNLKNIRFTGNLKRYSSINKILYYIEKTTSISFKVNKKSIMIYKKH